ncbi:MAG: cell wall hydrolase [Clostridia bacterium]|nr:cell wall hydrolase [Clostridia bacterium]NCC68498.1 cell wall hydrolase [Clostridia bacterium]
MKKVLSFPVAIALIFLISTGARADFEPEKDYSLAMIDAAESGDTEAGIEAELMRNEKIDALGIDEQKMSFNDLLLLARVIHSEAGSEWLSDEWKMAVGEVLLNRVASPEFPDTIEECVYQAGQYGGAGESWYENLIPYRSCVVAAKRLLSGERVLDEPSVVFQSNGPQGSGVFREYCDAYFGTTYLCYSTHPELYEG